MLKPTTDVEDLKRVRVSSNEPMGELLASSSADDNPQSGLEELKLLLDAQLKECDTVSKCSSFPISLYYF